jgi:hypothetical protein
VIRIDDGPADRVRVIGALQGAPLELLLEMAGGGSLALDLSEVRETDLDAVRILARLPCDRLRLIACPKWLALAIAREHEALLEKEAEVADEWPASYAPGA